jgi:outer membrane protein TolC
MNTMTRTIATLVACSLVLGAQGPGFQLARTTPAASQNRAPGQLPQSPAAVAVPQRVGISGGEERLLLEEAIQLALKNNLDVAVQQVDVDASKQAIRLAQGAFDGRFHWLPGIETRNSPTTSVLQGANGVLSEHFFRQNFTFEQRIPNTGAAFGIEFDNARNTSTTPFNSLNPFYTSVLAVNLSIPLLRNRATDGERTQILVRRKLSDDSQVIFEERVIDIVTQVSQAYWNLVAAREDVQVETEAVRLAQEQLNQNERQIKAGTLAPVEVYGSQAELERRRDTLFAAVSVVTQAENNLKTLLLPDRQDPFWNKEILPVDDRLLTPSGAAELSEAVSSAMKQRPELRDIRYRQDANLLQRRLDQNQTLPQVNLSGLYTNQGLAGTLSTSASNPFDTLLGSVYQQINIISGIVGIPPIAPPSYTLPPNVIGGYGTAVESVFAGRYQSVRAGVDFEFTFRNRAAKAQLAESTLEGKRLKLEETQAQQLIAADVRNSIQSLESTRERMTASDASVRAAREKLDSETRLFQTGESTNFLVLTRQNEYLDSRRRLLLARSEYNKAVARFEQSSGETLGAHQIKLQ